MCRCSPDSQGSINWTRSIFPSRHNAFMVVIASFHKVPDPSQPASEPTNQAANISDLCVRRACQIGSHSMTCRRASSASKLITIHMPRHNSTIDLTASPSLSVIKMQVRDGKVTVHSEVLSCTLGSVDSEGV